MAKLYLMVGIPGSGKSSFVVDNCNTETDVWVSRDAIRFSMLSEEDSYFAKERESFDQYVASIIYYLRQGKNVWADATQINAYSRGKLLRRVPRNAYDEIIAYYFDTPVGTCLTRNRRRTGRARVPDDVIFNMSNNITIPSEKENIFKVRMVNANGELQG